MGTTPRGMTNLLNQRFPALLMRIALRLTGPVLLALALLSVRNRVKR